MTDATATPGDPPPPDQRRIGRPTERTIPRTHLHDWLTSSNLSSRMFHAKCAAIAAERKIPLEYIPSRSTIDDMRVARSYPSLPVAYLIELATEAAVGLAAWTDDLVRHGTRHGKRHTKPAPQARDGAA